MANASSVWKTGSSLKQSSQDGMEEPQQHLSLGLSSPRTLQQSGKPLQWVEGDRTTLCIQFGTPKTPLGQCDGDLTKIVSSREGLEVNSS